MALQSAQGLMAAAAAALGQRHPPQQQQQPQAGHSLLSAGAIISPDDHHLAALLPPKAAEVPPTAHAAGAHLECIPDTAARPQLPLVPGAVTAAGAAAGGQLLRSPSMRLAFDFGELKSGVLCCIPLLDSAGPCCF
jgi:hypothetical protein